MTGVVEQIAIAPERKNLPVPVSRVRGQAGHGLEGEYHTAAPPSPAPR